MYRCVNLSQQIRGVNAYFLIEDYGNVRKMLLQEGFQNIYTLKNNKLGFDIKKTLEIVKRENIDIVIADRYGLKKTYVKEIRKHVKMVCISDLGIIDFPADLVINGFIGFKNGIVSNHYGVRCLVGPCYQILNKEYTKKIPPIRKRYTILATFGGFDEHNISEIFCQSLEEFVGKIKTKIILGPGTKRSKMIKDFEKKYTRYVTIVNSTKNMRADILRSRFGICSGGITTYEFGAMKVPFAIICQYKHQTKTASVWQQKGFAINLGLPNKYTSKKIKNYINNIINNKKSFFKIKHPTIDGYGAKRVAKEIIKIL